MCDLSSQDVKLVLKKELGKEEFKIVSVKNVSRKQKLCSSKLVCYFTTTEGGVQKLKLFAKRPCKTCNQNGDSKIEHELNASYLSYIRDAMNCDFLPNCLLSKSGGVVVFEDVTAKGFHRLGINESLELNECVRCVEAIARLHAASIVREAKEGKTLDNVYSCLESNKTHVEKYIEGKISAENLNTLRKIVDVYLCQFSSNVIEEAFRLMMNVRQVDTTSSYYQNCIIHNDIRPTTLFVRQSHLTNKVDCRLADFKCSTYNLPTYDLQTFLLTCTRKSLRDEYEDLLIRHYYRTLYCFATSYGVVMEDRLSWEDFASMYETTYPIVLASTPHLILDEVIPDGFRCDDLNFTDSSFDEVKHELIMKTIEDCSLYKHRLLEVLVEIFSVILT